MRKSIREAITKAADPKRKTLKLNNRGLEEFPLEITELTHLEGLELYRNRLTALPAEIGRMKNLEYLAVSRNDLIDLGPGFGALTALRALDLRENRRLEKLPSQIGQLTQLEWLDAALCGLRSLPAELASCAATLKRLDVLLNPFDEFPDVLLELPNLDHLNVARCGLTLPARFLRERPQLREFFWKGDYDPQEPPHPFSDVTFRAKSSQGRELETDTATQAATVGTYDLEDTPRDTFHVLDDRNQQPAWPHVTGMGSSDEASNHIELADRSAFAMLVAADEIELLDFDRFTQTGMLAIARIEVEKRVCVVAMASHYRPAETQPVLQLLWEREQLVSETEDPDYVRTHPPGQPVAGIEAFWIDLVLVERRSSMSASVPAELEPHEYLTKPNNPPLAAIAEPEHEFRSNRMRCRVQLIRISDAITEVLIGGQTVVPNEGGWFLNAAYSTDTLVAPTLPIVQVT